MDTVKSYRRMIMDNIEYDILVEECKAERVDEVVELMPQAASFKRVYVRIAGGGAPAGGR